MRSLFVAIPAMALLAGAASAQPIVPLTGSGSVRPAPANGTLNVPTFITNPSARNAAPGYAPAPTTTVQQGQFIPPPLPAAPAIGIQPNQIPPSILERGRAASGSH